MTKYDVSVTAQEEVAGIVVGKNYHFSVDAPDLKTAVAEAWAKVEEVGGNPQHINIGKAYEPPVSSCGATQGQWS